MYALYNIDWNKAIYEDRQGNLWIGTFLNVKQLQEENMRMQAELDISRHLQQVLLPRARGLEVAGFMEPAEKVGGDYYDVLVHANGVKIGIDDVTGHGLESGILATINRIIYDNVQRKRKISTVSFTVQSGYVSLPVSIGRKVLRKLNRRLFRMFINLSVKNGCWMMSRWWY